MQPINQPAFERIVKMATDVRDKVWNWMHEPEVIVEEEWKEIREPTDLVILEIANILLKYGHTVREEIFLQPLRTLKSKSQKQGT